MHNKNGGESGAVEMGMPAWRDRAVLVMESQSADAVGWRRRVSYGIANTLLV